eukprot:2088010-Pleurochrysis_carterae.AAC.4
MGGGASKARKPAKQSVSTVAVAATAAKPANAQGAQSATPSPASADSTPDPPASAVSAKTAPAPVTDEADAERPAPLQVDAPKQSESKPVVKDSKPVGKASNPAVTASKPAGKDVAVLRLVKLQEYVDAARNGSSSLCYDFLDPSLYVDAPFEELMATVRNDTAVVSWRWPFRKPGKLNHESCSRLVGALGLSLADESAVRSESNALKSRGNTTGLYSMSIFTGTTASRGVDFHS